MDSGRLFRRVAGQVLYPIKHTRSSGAGSACGRLTLTASEQDTQQRDTISSAASCFDAAFLYKNNLSADGGKMNKHDIQMT